jgi:quinol monooxygenase YgiN
MSDAVSWAVDVSIKAGQLDAFKALVEEMVQWSRADSDTLSYEWFLNEDNTSCHIYERYASSAAALAHVKIFIERYAEPFMGTVDMKGMTVFGPAEAELKGIMGGFGANFMGQFNGFAR